MKSELKREPVTKRQVRTWNLFLRGTENICLTLSTPHFRGFFNRSQKDVQMPPPWIGRMAWILEVQQLSLEQTADMNNQRWRFFAPASENLPPFIFSSSHTPAVRYYNVFELQI